MVFLNVIEHGVELVYTVRIQLSLNENINGQIAYIVYQSHKWTNFFIVITLKESKVSFKFGV